MVTKSDVKQTMYDELATVAGTFVQSPYDHVGVINDNEEHPYPFIGFEEFTRPTERGMDGAIHTDSVNYVNGSVDSITYRKDSLCRFDIFALVDMGNEGLKDDLFSAIANHFDKYNMWLTPSDFHADVEDIVVGTSNDADRMDETIRGDRIRIDVEYGRYQTYDGVTAMEQVHLDMDAEGADAFSGTVTN